MLISLALFSEEKVIIDTSKPLSKISHKVFTFFTG